MSLGSKLVLVPTHQAYTEYVSWWKGRGLPWAPPAPKLGIFVAHADYGLITGACVIETGGPVVLLEHFSVSPKNRMLWREAAVRTLLEFRRTAVMLGKLPMICVDRKSLAKVCAESGFAFTGARVMLAPMVSG